MEEYTITTDRTIQCFLHGAINALTIYLPREQTTHYCLECYNDFLKKNLQSYTAYPLKEGE